MSSSHDQATERPDLTAGQGPADGAADLTPAWLRHAEMFLAMARRSCAAIRDLGALATR